MDNSVILNFIKRFQNEGTIKTFTQGCCYWFAKILDERFNSDIPDSGIWYNEINNHFATLIGLHLYDITGDLGYIVNNQELENWCSWEDYLAAGDELNANRVIRDCIDF